MKKERRNGVKIMGQLTMLAKPLLPVMALAVIPGVIGYLCAVFLTVLAGGILLHGVQGISLTSGILSVPVHTLCIGLAVMAAMRGVLHYAEQYCNHFIAFKLLAVIRHQVFAALRKLCPARLEGRDRGNLISVITADIELLEVFYAHTISPIIIAVLTSLIMVLFIGQYHICAGLLALCAYLFVGAAIPLWNGRRGGKKGMCFRTEFGDLNSFVLDSLRGLSETIQYGRGADRKEQMTKRSEKLSGFQKELSALEGAQKSFTNLAILGCSLGMLFLTVFLYGEGSMEAEGALMSTLAMMGSFGPVAALSSLSNNLNQTLASAERVLSLLEEKPMVEEVPGEAGEINFTGAAAEHITFGYGEEVILEHDSFLVEPGRIVGIHGPSGSGKSTLLKLFMRFWDADAGRVTVSGMDVRDMPTTCLRDMESYVTQSTWLFHDSIANNIAVGKPGASIEEIIEAAKKASVHEFIMTLPKGYDTEVGELGDTLSGGERQRIGIARAFLHDAPFVLLDEPTSNLDALNEGVILKALKEERGRKTMLLVSHRRSTMNIADKVYEMAKGRIS